MFTFLKQNGFIKHQIQKGFTAKTSGTLEHTTFMGHIINKARTIQRSLVVTLLNLESAFGEVHHNFMTSVLSNHHVPSHIQNLVSCLYLDFKNASSQINFKLLSFHDRRGILQGDCLSPLLFNLCFNTFIQYVKAEKCQQLGFPPQDENDRLLQLVHWFKFADDAAIVTSGE